MIVADCSLIACFLLGEREYASAEALWLRDSDWMAPSLWEVEFASVLVKYERAGELSAANVLEHARRGRETFAGATHYIALERALQVARASGCSSYDSYYIALAEDLGVKLYTYDKEILRKCPTLARKP